MDASGVSAVISVLAHRGSWSEERTENTVDAFLNARRLGADGVELDVRRGAEATLVVHHDAALAGGGVIALTPPASLPVWVPSLAAALDACAGMSVNIEVKNLPTEPGYDPDETVAIEVATLIGRRGMQARVVVSSFSLAAIDAVRAAAPDVPTGWLTLPGFDQVRAAETAAERGHTALHPHHSSLTAAIVAAVHAAGLAVSTWTVDDTDRMRELAAMGVDTIITNRPARALEALAPWRQ